jgi:hypothetical protein
VSFKDKAKDIAGDIADKAGDIVDKVEEKIPDSVKEKAGDLADKAGDLVDKAKGKLGIGGDEHEPEQDVPAGEASGEPATPSTPVP